MKKLILLLLISCSYVQAAEQTQPKQCVDAWGLLEAGFARTAKFKLTEEEMDNCDIIPSLKFRKVCSDTMLSLKTAQKAIEKHCGF